MTFATHMAENSLFAQQTFTLREYSRELSKKRQRQHQDKTFYIESKASTLGIRNRKKIWGAE
jgi:hypothetical protein